MNKWHEELIKRKIWMLKRILKQCLSLLINQTQDYDGLLPLLDWWFFLMLKSSSDNDVEKNQELEKVLVKGLEKAK